MEIINVYTLLQVREKEIPYDIDHCVAGSLPN